MCLVLQSMVLQCSCVATEQQLCSGLRIIQVRISPVLNIYWRFNLSN